jgi:hypothetical protein
MRLPAAFISVLVLASGAGAQWTHVPLPGIPRTPDGRPNLLAPAPRDGHGRPDLSGVWMQVPLYGKDGYSDYAARPELTDEEYQRLIANPGTPAANLNQNLQFRTIGGAEIPFRPAALALYQERLARESTGSPSERCRPKGIPAPMLPPVPFKVVQTPGLTIVLFEEFNRFRQIFTDGRPKPHLDIPSWWGYSMGSWDGDTFVVDTTGFNDKTWLDKVGHPHTDALHTIERFRRIDFGHMVLELTIDDPKAYSKAWTVRIPFEFVPDIELMDDACESPWFSDDDSSEVIPKDFPRQ